MKILIIITLSFLFYSHSLLAGKQNTIGYPSANISQQGGWTIISLVEDGNHVLWFFAPEEHAAHPAMIKRTYVEKDGGIEIVMVSFCKAPKQKCDDLTEEFKHLNKQYK